MGTVTQFQKGYMFSLHLENKGIKEAMSRFPRSDFVPSEYAHLADQVRIDQSVRLTDSYVMPRPSDIVQALKLLHITQQDRVLLVGAGTGFETALVSALAKEVDAVESGDELYEFAVQKLPELQVDNVNIYHGDGSVGLPYKAPYDAIVVFAAFHSIPRPLLRQLKVGGRIVIPVGGHDAQRLTLAIKREQHDEVRTSTKQTHNKKVHFLPLVGRQGYKYQTGQNPVRTMKRPHFEKKQSQ